MRFVVRTGRLLLAGLMAGVWIGEARPCVADDAVGEQPSWLKEVRFNGFLASCYSYNFNRPVSGTNQLRVFDFEDNTFTLDEFELVAQKVAAIPRDSGFRVDLTLGSSIPPVTASAGLFRDNSGEAGDIDIHQAFATYVAPLGSGLRFDAGKFITGHGYEVIDGYDGWNDNATRSLLFGYAIPFTHVGVRASYAVSPRVGGMVMLVNGWDVARDNNRSKSVGAQVTVSPRPPLTVIVSGMFGPERTGNNADPRTLLDVVVILKPNSKLTMGGNLDWGSDRNALGPGRDGRWSGVAGYARMSISGALALSLRGEYFEDLGGVRTGVAQKLREFTATPELRLSPHLLVRGDARVDHSNRSVFEKSQGFAKSQPTALIEAIYSF